MVSFETSVGQQGVIDTAAEVGRDVAAAVDTLAETARTQVRTLFRTTWPVLVAVAALGLIAVAALLINFAKGNALNLPDLLSLFMAVAGGFGAFRLRQQQGDSNAAVDAEQEAAKRKIDTAAGPIGLFAFAETAGALPKAAAGAG
jgi:hypothetical protein